jgi:hypothetical protein
MALGGVGWFCIAAAVVQTNYVDDREPAVRKKKSELVDSLAKLFADAAEGRVEDAALAAKVNTWLPVNLREPVEADEPTTTTTA